MRDPESVRGQREAKNAAPTAPPVTLQFPEDLETVEAIWQDLTAQLLAANVQLQQVDAYAVELAARCTKAIRDLDRVLEDPELDGKSRIKAITAGALLSRDQMRYLQAICATPGSRIRIVKPTPKGEQTPAENALDAIYSQSQ